MLFWIIENIVPKDSFIFNVIHCSIFFRIILSFFCALFISLITGSYAIIKLRNLHVFQIIRVNGPKSHVLKKGTPALGGLVILTSIFISIVMWIDLFNWYIWYIILILILYGVLGLIDDFLKIKRNNSNGLNVIYKYFWQSLIALILIIVIYIVHRDTLSTQLVMPFVTSIMPELGIWYIVLAYFVIVGTSNAVNLSDGLDGLAIVPIILIASGLGLVAYITNSEYLSDYLYIPYIHHSGELMIVCAAISGASLGFLWFNTYPARIFMGDVGSLSLGGILGIIAVFLRQEFLLLIMGGIFVVEVLSVFFQVSYFKFFRKRIFKMAPIHHHFELKGCPEPRIVVRFWIISLVLVLFGLITLQLRCI